jgi:nucleotide-binding universal stress UspA family protein
MAHARVTILGYGLDGETLQRHLQEAKEALGGGLAALDVHATPNMTPAAIVREVERQPFDLMVTGFRPHADIEWVERLLQAGDHHLLLVPKPQSAPTRALICVASGEPGKEDVLFAGRLVRHLGARATLVSVLPTTSTRLHRERAERFLAGGIRALQVLGVPAQTELRIGVVHDEIVDTVRTGDYDLLVLGAPLAGHDGRISFNGLIGQVLEDVPDRMALIVRSHRVTDALRAGQFTNNYHEEIVA